MGTRWHAVAALGFSFAAATAMVAVVGLCLPLAGVSLVEEQKMGVLQKVANLMWKRDGNTYNHIWPVMPRVQIVSCFLTWIIFLYRSVFLCPG